MKLSARDLQFVAGVAMFRGLKPETIAHVVAPAHVVVLRPREALVRQGDPATAFFIVLSGLLKLYRNNPAGEEAVLEIVKPGATFSEAVAFTGNRYLVTAEAVTDARVVRVPADHFVRCNREHPDISLAIVASISEHMHYLVQQVEGLKAQSGLQRVAEYLASFSATERGGSTFVLPYDKTLIARQLGLMPESLSRAFARLRRIGVRVSASRVTVEDVGRLRQIAANERAAARGALRQ